MNNILRFIFWFTGSLVLTFALMSIVKNPAILSVPDSKVKNPATDAVNIKAQIIKMLAPGLDNSTPVK